ncbi:hypothetical protein V8E53_000157 [Lactarius tabidus]
MLWLDEPVNHSSISSWVRTLSVGDLPHVYLYGMPGGARITFTPLAQLFSPFEPPPNAYPVHNDSTLHASFCTVFSLDSSKFTVASQEGASKTMGTASRWDWAMPHTGRLDGACGM